MPVAIVRTAWAGTSGGPGLTQTAFAQTDPFNLDATEAQAAVNAVRAFWDGIKGLIPDEVGLTVSPVVDVYNQANGELLSSQSAATAPVLVQGTSTAVYSMPTGVKLNLNTTTIRNGRRVRGAIYIVPISSAIFSAAGVVAGANRTTFNTAGATLMGAFVTAGLKMVVYSRPLKNSLGVVTREGAHSDVTSIECNEKAAILRGRRD